MQSYRNQPPRGWVNMNDGTIGNIGSGATIRANKDTFQLYSSLYTTISDAWAPVVGGRSGSGVTMAEAVSDFSAGKALRLPRSMGRVLAGLNPEFNASIIFTAAAATDLLTVSSTTTLTGGTPVLVSNSGGALPSPLLANTTYYVINQSATTIKLAYSINLAQVGTAIDLLTDGSGTNTLLSPLGSTFGEGQHQLTVAELAAHEHDYTFLNNPGGTRIQGGVDYRDTTEHTSSTGGDEAHNNMQPTNFVNVFIKL
jgi:hypothetical protein